MPNIIETLASKLSKHQVVPFFGAGCSLDVLKVDWDGLCQLMNKETSSAFTDNLISASEYVRKFGKDKFCDFLKNYLMVDTVSDEQIEIYLVLLGLGFLCAYTTNQDNVFEKVIERYKRKYNVVYDIKSIAEIAPKYPTLYKFHGDLGASDTIVFTQEDYQSRMADSNNPMDIRLRSDMLSRSLIFIGYSFNDQNIRLLFNNLKKLFGGDLPESYLIQYLPNKSFAQLLKDEYGITAIDCREEIPGSKDNADAFIQFLKELSNETISMRQSSELGEIFTPAVPIGKRVVTKYELSGMKTSLTTRSNLEAITIFRSIVDASEIPMAFEKDVQDLFVELCKCSLALKEASEIRGALFNLDLRNSGYLFECYAACLALGNIVLFNDYGFNPQFSPITKRFDKDVDVFAFARAIEMLRIWGRKISPEFYKFFGYHYRNILPRAVIQKEFLPYIEEQFNFAYAKGKTTYENPLSHADRVNKGRMQEPGFKDILASVISMVPKALERPYGP